MRDIYVIVPKGTVVPAAADDFDRASMAMLSPGLEQDMYEIVNVELYEEGD